MRMTPQSVQPAESLRERPHAARLRDEVLRIDIGAHLQSLLPSRPDGYWISTNASGTRKRSAMTNSWSRPMRKPVRRRHATVPTQPGSPMKVEHEYTRCGAWAYLAALDASGPRLRSRPRAWMPCRAPDRESAPGFSPLLPFPGSAGRSSGASPARTSPASAEMPPHPQNRRLKYVCALMKRRT